MSDQNAFELFMSKQGEKVPENMTSPGNMKESRILLEMKIIISVVSRFLLGYFIGSWMKTS